MRNPSNGSTIKYCMIGFFSYFGDARVRGYAELLRKAGNQVDVLGMHGSQASQVLDQDGLRLFSIPVSRSRKNRLTYLLEYGLCFLHLSLRLTKLYFQNRYEAIHVHNMPDFLVFCALIPRLFGAKVILDIHDPMPEVYMSKYPAQRKGLVVRLLRLEEKLSAAFASAVITANPHFKENLVARGLPAHKITTVQNYPDPAIFQPAKRQIMEPFTHERFTVIFPGTIAPRYGLKVAIRAIPYLVEKIPNIRLLIIGRENEHARELRALAEQLGVSNYVDIRPGIPITEVPEQLLQADAGIYPALPDEHMSIAIPGKVLEFAIMGLPIVSSRLQIVEEMFDEPAVLFFEPGNSQQFSECILRLHADPVLRQHMVQQADQMLAERQSREREIQAYFDLLSHLLPGRSKSFDLREVVR